MRVNQVVAAVAISAAWWSVHASEPDAEAVAPTGLEEIRVLIDQPEGKPFEPAQVKSIYEKSSALVTLITKT